MAEYLASIFGTEKDKVNCSFYFKIGACRHGDRCSRLHNKPTFSQTILLQNMYQNPQNQATVADGSTASIMSDVEAQEHYDAFFEDVFLEMEEKYGDVEEMNVCDNLGDHLVGNVYIKFRFEEDAEKAVTALNNRWYNGQPIYAELSPVTDFREACCRQYEMGECTRGGFYVGCMDEDVEGLELAGADQWITLLVVHHHRDVEADLGPDPQGIEETTGQEANPDDWTEDFSALILSRSKLEQDKMDDSARSKQRDDDLRDRRGERRDRGGRKRDKRGRDRERVKRSDRPPRDKQDGSSASAMSVKPPIILTKPMAEKALQDAHNKDQTPIQVFAIQRRDDSTASTPGVLSSSFGSTKSSKLDSSLVNRSIGMDSSHLQDERKEQTHVHSSATSLPSTPVTHGSKVDSLATGIASLQAAVQNTMTESVRVVDESFHWSERALSSLVDQTDFMVVGVVGMQGVGKSTVLSMIGERKRKSSQKKLIFRPQSKQDTEKSLHKTDGIDLYVTSERVILLDTQPLLSPSILDRFLRHEKKVPSDFGTAEICVEMQSLQILTFLYTVCHTVIIVMDYFADYSLLKFIKTAEMLKPSTVSHSVQDANSSTNPDELDDHFPHIVFVYNRSDKSNFDFSHIKSVCQVTDKFFEHSKLKIRGGASILGANLLPFCKLKSFEDYQDMSIFLLPVMDESEAKTDDECLKLITSYQGHPSFASLIASLRNQTASTSRHHLTHHPLTERTWFHYAARTWETVKKSPLLAEYQRLLTT
eukprot:gene11122-12292_t